jgi:hypothetical protein
MGALELGNAGVSPGPSVPCASGGSTIGAGSSVAGSPSGMSNSTSFDGGGINGRETSGLLPPSCGGSANGRFASPQFGASGLSSGGNGFQPSSPGEPVGRPGIPLGSTELGGAGLSPPPAAPALIPETSSPLGSPAVGPPPRAQDLTGLTPPSPQMSGAPGSTTGASSLILRSRSGASR